ncbi:MAG: RNA methyltransferase [Ancalomicrobiaceae bacterium]|nr:RNA methyltransferase [Ancalomicrobiaceae bacterium]
MIENPTSLPVIVLVETQMGENIGAAARAMANFGLKELRLIKPRDGWPSDKARAAASRGDTIIDAVTLYDTLADALKDLNLVFATTARQHDLAKAVASPARAATLMGEAIRHGDRTGVVFGRERWGLTSDEVALCDAILTIPVDEAFASLNIAQAVILVAYEWRQHLLANPDWTPFPEKERSPQATKDELFHLFEHLESALDRADFFRPDHKRPHMVRNLRSIFHKARLNEQEIRTLRGAIAALEQRPSRITPRRIRNATDPVSPSDAAPRQDAAGGSDDIDKS